jgi:hypothetical protein
MSIEDCRRRIRDCLARREQNFLDLLERAVYAYPRSPYRILLEQAGIELGDVAALVHADGVDGTLERLYEAGVHLTLEEQRGKVAVRRGSLELDVSFDDLVNPLVAGIFQARTGGSRSAGRITLVNFEALTQQVAHHGVFLSAVRALDRPAGVWHPPIVAGINTVLSQAKLDRRARRWFVPAPLDFRERVLAATAWTLGRTASAAMPFPQHVPPARAEVVAEWLAYEKTAATPAFLATTPSSAARICVTAADRGLDISGTLFRMGGEPYTPAKAAIIADAGCRGACHYYMTEAGGQVGIACADPVEAGDVHVCTDKLVIAQRMRTLPWGGSAGTLSLTTLLPTAPSILINFETDDFAVMEERECECEIGTLGLSRHLHTIRSVEKLTGEGVNFIGETLIALVEHALPSRFGGSATDYQLVEQERDGMTRVLILVSPRVGTVDDTDVLRETLAFLEQAGRAEKGMAAAWRASDTLEVVRAEPRVTRAAKVLPLHVGGEEIGL